MKDVKYIAAEFQRYFPTTDRAKRCVLVKAHVPYGQARAAQSVRPFVSELSEWLRSKGRRIEVPVDVPRLNVEAANGIPQRQAFTAPVRAL